MALSSFSTTLLVRGEAAQDVVFGSFKVTSLERSSAPWRACSSKVRVCGANSSWSTISFFLINSAEKTSVNELRVPMGPSSCSDSTVPMFVARSMNFAPTPKSEMIWRPSSKMTSLPGRSPAQSLTSCPSLLIPALMRSRTWRAPLISLVDCSLRRRTPAEVVATNAKGRIDVKSIVADGDS